MADPAPNAAAPRPSGREGARVVSERRTASVRTSHEKVAECRKGEPGHTSSFGEEARRREARQRVDLEEGDGVRSRDVADDEVDPAEIPHTERQVGAARDVPDALEHVRRKLGGEFIRTVRGEGYAVDAGAR